MIYEKLKSEYDQISGSWPEEAKTFSLSLLLIIEDLSQRLKKLEDQVAQNSRNSSKPPSQDTHQRPKKTNPKSSKRKAGGQKGHVGEGAKLKDNPDDIVAYTLGDCPQCGQDLRPEPLVEQIRKQIEDIPEIKTKVIEYQIEVKSCPTCQALWQAGGCDQQHEFEYGPNIKSLAVYLSAYQFLPQQRIKALLGIFGIQISTGTLNNFRKSAAQRIEPFEKALRQNLIQAPSAHFDETGIKVGGVTHWVHVACTNLLFFSVFTAIAVKKRTRIWVFCQHSAALSIEILIVPIMIIRKVIIAYAARIF